VGKNSKIQAKIPKIQPVFAVISAKNQKFKGIYRGVNFWIEIIFCNQRGMFVLVVWGGGRVYKLESYDLSNSKFCIGALLSNHQKKQLFVFRKIYKKRSINLKFFTKNGF